MKKILLIFVFLFSHIFVFAQTDNAKEEGKKEIIDGYKFFFTDRGVDAKIDYTLALDDQSSPINVAEQKISPLLAIFLFKQQKNRFEYRKKIFYWNDTPIPLFIELNDFLKKFPDKDFSEDIKKFDPKFNSAWIMTSYGVTFDFFKNNGLYYLTKIETRVNKLNNPKENDFGIFLVEGFPVKTSYLDHDASHFARNKLNEITKYDFSRGLGMGNYMTSFEKIEIKDDNILQNYFADNERFNRMKDRRVENSITYYFSSGRFTFSNLITYSGTDPEEIHYPPPTKGNGDEDYTEKGLYDKNGKKTGEWRIYEKEKLCAVGYFENNIRTGEWKYYHKNGQLSSIGRFENEKQVGKWSYYHDNGQLESINNYNEDGKLKDGERKSYHKNGQLHTFANYKNGKLFGEFKGYYDNGNLSSTGQFDENKNKTGEWKYYHENGKLQAVGNYENYKETGEWKHYDEQGNLIETEKF
ncbi:antitoxin component YwqK of YwqJK toxin-antitoxin module [Flavobacterium arsenatis]|uniref:Antitoxin component YwqK of YwqJK toxin-antitoxin module n=1 Tax=Flavobacterium arsenatis TaxID=1484332 RepID=A0ABU1TUG9_9FLAO|nr:toxin-antitoxin system YwqK family antitoxin [Flavobacterium arsenatis]MDR6969529.1 antitoxin component YwqK of YwqJK toxin-antitoxin module [Flavobacterium arsenatis]